MGPNRSTAGSLHADLGGRFGPPFGDQADGTDVERAGGQIATEL
jgi:hypothetical protein